MSLYIYFALFIISRFVPDIILQEVETFASKYGTGFKVQTLLKLDLRFMVVCV